MRKTVFCPCIFVLVLFQCGDPTSQVSLTAEEHQWLERHSTGVRIALERNFAPYIFVDDRGQPAGISVDLIGLIEKRVPGLQFRFGEPQHLTQILEGVRSGQVDVVTSLMQTEERSSYLLFTQPYLVIPSVLLVRKDWQGPASLDRMQDIAIGVADGYAVAEYVNTRYPKHHFVAMPNDVAGLRQLSFGEVDALVVDLGTASHNIEKEAITNLRVANEVGFSYVLGMASLRDDPILNRLLEKGLGTITKAEHQAIYRRWVGLETAPFYRTKLFIYGLPILVALIALVIAWNTMLRRMVQARTQALVAEIAEREKAQQLLRDAHHQLEQRVVERTDELRRRNQQLQEEVGERRRIENDLRVAREIATCSVHNIGNVVNSLMVGGHSMGKVLAQSRAPVLRRICGLLDENRDELGPFFQEGAKGQKLLAFLRGLEVEFQDQEDQLRDELQQILEKVQLIRDAARGQQTIAGAPEGACKIHEVVEDALRIQLSTEEGQSIRIQRDYRFQESLTLPRTKLAHIFMNIVKNAKEAMLSTPIEDRELHVSITALNGKQVQVRFRDTGMGIDPQHLAKMGTFGFTTKKDGHGFGLKFCAETLRGMGGDMVVQSEGVGKGAAFVLDIPRAVSEVAKS